MNAPDTTSNFLSAPVFAIGGLDPSGGAGIIADLKTICAYGCYGAAAVTAITEQNSLGVSSVDCVGSDRLSAQMRAVLDDLKPSTIKIGMMGNAGNVAAICDGLEGRGITLVVDPVFASSSGHTLLDEGGVGLLKTRLLPKTSLLTPNLSEAAHLADMPIHNPDDMLAAGERIRALGAKAVLITGGHLEGAQVIDVLIDESGARQFRGDKISSLHTHGTGCTLASAIACNLAQGRPLDDSVVNARDFVRRAILTAPGLGAGHGPLNHLLPVDKADG